MCRAKNQVAYDGPPFVATNASVKTFSAAITPRTRLNSSVGEIIGRTTWRKRCQGPAPSIWAASSSEGGTPCSPDRKITVVAPPSPAQSETTTTAGSAQPWLWNQPGPSIPTQPSTWLTGPTVGWNSQVQTSASATAGVSVGR